MRKNYKSIQYLNSLLTKNKIEEVFNCLNQIASENKEETDFREIIITLQARYYYLLAEDIKGTVLHNDYITDRNKIISAIQKLFSGLFIHLFEDAEKNLIIAENKEDFNIILNDLAQELAFNYYHVSFSDETQIKTAEEVFQKESLTYFHNNHKKRRNILIVGAGATHSSCPYIPFGKQLRDFIENENENYKELMKNYNQKINKKNTTFDPEEYLAELNSNLSPEDKIKLRDYIHNLYNKKYLPTYNYEIIAHLFKHRFIDVIINFNFDELLDEAIEEELGKSQYIKVLNEGDCENIDNILIDKRLRTPIYIKIHGTASTKSSLKFTKEHHKLEVASEMKEFILKWIKGQLKDEVLNENEGRICSNVICLGFDIERADFYTYLRGNLKEDSKFYLINWNKEIEATHYGLENFFSINTGQKEIARHIKLQNWAKNSCNTKQLNSVPMADFLNCLWHNHILPIFQDNYKPRSIARHNIVTNIFYNAFAHGPHEYYKDYENMKEKYKELTSYFRSITYYFERTLVEIAIMITKNKGIIEPQEAIKDERINRFYGLYKSSFYLILDEAQNKKKSIEEVLDKDAPFYCKELITLNKIYLDFFKMEGKYSFSNNLLTIGSIHQEELGEMEEDCDTFFKYTEDINQENLLVDLSKPENLHILICYRLFNISKTSYIFKKFDERFQENKRFKREIIIEVVEDLKKIKNGFTYDIVPRFKDETWYTFESVKRKHVLVTNLALSYQFSSMLHSYNEWDALLLISERGKFISTQLEKINDNDRTELEKKQIIVISCFEAVSEVVNRNYDISQKALESLSKQYLQNQGLHKFNIEMHFLPYWEHENHMALFLKFKNKDKYIDNTIPYHTINGIDHSVIEITRSIYYNKKGFSNKINPLSIVTKSANDLEKGFIKNDQERLLEIFYTHYVKAITFGTNGQYIPNINPNLSFFDENRNINYTFDDFLLKLFNKRLK